MNNYKGNYKHQLSMRVRELMGLSMDEFCRKYLNTDIKAFQYRLRNKVCYPNEVIYISWLLGESVADLFGMDFMNLMGEQGPEEITKKINKLFKEATEQQRETYLKFIGSESSIKSTEKVQASLPTPIKKQNDKVPEVPVKKESSKKDVKKLVDFFEENIRVVR